MVNILVTGATKGIGKAIAQELKSVGNVYVTGRNVEALREYKNYCVCDLAEDIDILESFIADKKIDILISGVFEIYMSVDVDKISSKFRIFCNI